MDALSGRISKKKQRINIVCWNIENADLSGYRFINCDFSAIFLRQVNMDFCTFYNCTFSGCEFHYLSLVKARLKKIECEDIKISDVTMRNSSCSEINICNSNMEKVRIDDCGFSKMTVGSTKIDNMRFKDSTFVELKGYENEILQGEISGLTAEKIYSSHIDAKAVMCIDLKVENSIIELGKLKESKLENSYFDCCKFVSLQFKEIEIERTDFFNGFIKDIDLREFSIEKIGLLHTVLLDCQWPEQRYKVSALGRYKRAPHLLRQPVEDITGISPKLRNEIKTAQLVEETYLSSKAWYNKAWSWFWGITTEYGRSLARLTLVCGSVILLLMVMFFLSYPIENIKQHFGTYLIESCKCVFLSFVGISSIDEQILNYAQNIILIMDRVFGVISTGLWVGVAANKIGSID